jgi:hypothetical protein
MGFGADDPSAVEVRIKAAFLYKFTEYVDWPPNALPSEDSPFTIAVLGDDRVADELAEILAHRPTNGRRFQMKRLVDDEAVSGMQILFVGRAREGGARLKAVAEAPILVVTDAIALPRTGSTINFVVAGERVRFDVALDDAERRGLRLSSRLLTVAQSVRGGGH